ncbi:MAG: DUF3987 domain-containing protein [Desulfobaccales bacterium]
MTNPLCQAALICVGAGLSVIPTSLQTKAPVCEWKPYQTHLPTDSEIRGWFGKNKAMGIITGTVSGNLEILDFDNRAELFYAWADIVSGEAPGLLERLVIQKSKNDGRHAAYRCSEGKIPGNTKLAQRAVDVTASMLERLGKLGIDPEDENSVKKVLPSIEVEILGKKYVPRLIEGKFTVIVTLIETRGEGGQFLAHPTPGYELRQGDFLQIPTITAEERQILVNAARALNEYVDPARVEGVGYRLPKEARRPGDDFNERGDVKEILARYGWEPVGARGAYQHYRRPGKDRGQSASLIDGRWFHVFTSSAAPFDMERNYSPFAVYALLEHGGDFINAARELAKLGYGDKGSQPNPKAPKTDNPMVNWELAAQLFPRIPFPWEVLPGDIADSLQQLGRACATSPYALPGAGFCLMGSIMGRTIVVSPKESWEAPLIFWLGDIRESGEGKTPGVQLMAEAIYEAQRKEEIAYREALADYHQLPKKVRDKEPPPAPPRGYFVSDLTLEGLRDDLINSPHGGIVVIQDELSAFLSGQNQYKSKGTDREAWLKLFDGKPARVVRAGRSMYLNGARVSIFGGVQPKVFKTFFAGEDRLYLEDGTLFRFLLTYEPPTYYDLTAESWGDRSREKWETVLNRALDWVNGKIFDCEGRIHEPTRMILSSEAQERFFEWRNQIFSFKDQLPAQLRGFLPKAAEYVLRLTGLIHCMEMFSIGRTPQAILSVEDLERGIKTVSFYLGQIQGALRMIEEDGYAPPEVNERSFLLAQSLDKLRPHIQDGRLAIGFIHKHYNIMAPKTQKIGSPRGMGAVLRAVKLTIPPGKYDANGHRSVKCLEWNKNTETFIEQCLRCLQSQNSQDWQGLEGTDDEDPMSASSAEPAEGFKDNADISERMSASETCIIIEPQDNADVADIVEVEI